MFFLEGCLSLQTCFNFINKSGNFSWHVVYVHFNVGDDQLGVGEDSLDSFGGAEEDVYGVGAESDSGLDFCDLYGQIFNERRGLSTNRLGGIHDRISVAGLDQSEVTGAEPYTASWLGTCLEQPNIHYTFVVKT